MPRVRYTADSGRYRITGQTFEPGDVHEVSAALADHLVDDVGEFERADDADAGAGETKPASADVHEGDRPLDADKADDASGADDLVATLQDQTIPEIEDDLESGRFDDRLDELAQAESEGKDRAGIHDAIGVRRAEIEEA
jgi:hypothetical protein